MSDGNINPSMPLLLNLPDALKEEIVEHLLSGSERNAEHRKLAIRAMKRLSATRKELRRLDKYRHYHRVVVYWNTTWRDEGWWTATVVGVHSRNPKLFRLQYDKEGKRATGTDLTAYERAGWLRWLAVGDRVLGRFGRHGHYEQWYPGNVRALQDDGTVHIKYDHNDEEEHVPRRFITLVAHGPTTPRPL